MQPNRFYRASLICGLVPLAIGVTIFLLWLATRWDGLAIAGLLAIAGGLIAVPVGLGCLIAHVYLSWKPEDRQPIVRQLLVGLAAIWVNFPVVLAIVIAVAYLDKPAQLNVTNLGTPIEQFALSGACDQIKLGTIPHGARVERRFDIRRDGQLVFDGVRNGQPVRGLLNPIVTPDQRVSISLKFDHRGEWSVSVAPGKDILARVFNLNFYLF